MKHKDKVYKKRRVTKLTEYLEENDKPRFRSYAKKHKLDICHIKLANDSNLLHRAAEIGNPTFIRYFLKKGVDPSYLNAHGQLPIHVAVNFAKQGHKYAYTDLVLPLVQACPHSLDTPNANGLTPRELLKEFKENISSDSETSDSSESSSEGSVEDTAWNQRLAEEFIDEHEETSGGLYQDDGDRASGGRSRETYDEWANRIYKERNGSKHTGPVGYSRKTKRSRTSSTGPDKRPKISEDRRKAFEDHMARVREETLEEQRLKRNITHKRQIAAYEHMCHALFRDKNDKGSTSSVESDASFSFTSRRKLLGDKDEKLRYTDIPWPFNVGPAGTYSLEVDIDKITVFLFDGVVRGSSEYEKYLKTQQRRWHPDRFLQKCGERVVEKDKENVLCTVTKISQLLNNLSQALK